ncbi:hypothetical protein ERD78_04475 [Allopusillimonas soli]|uniref:Peptidase inhibitor I78 family protein n=1 Tax=Allopusillimonas soli TaxID=659016 RepID=A0A853F807_9BURK|nr:I78 family peptidase inhibitor [Allopusillimonas soli]NYT36117.1 hypothetical protein [Allopusillimonas soli]TEA76453.1 hypothetical protein ERD78_04475 [Allopusillimonas soli]
MPWKFIPGAFAVVFLLAGCAGGASNISDSGSAMPSASTESRNGDTCDADLAESAVGKKVSPDLIEQYRKAAHAKQARALRPHDVITMEYNPQRLNLKVDDQDIVVSVNCS